MKTTEEIRDYLKTNIRPRADEVLKAHKKETDELREQIVKLEAAIEGKKERLIKLHTEALKAETAQLANRLSRTGKILQDLEDLEPEDGFGPNLREVEKLTADLGELERKLTKNYSIAKQALDKGNDALEADKAEIDADEVTREWAVMEAYLKKQLTLGKERLDEIKALNEKARKAAASRDEKALQEAVKAGAALRDFKPTAKEMLDGQAEFWAEYDPKKLGEELQQQLARDQAAFKKLLEELSGITDNIARIAKEMSELEVAPPDAKKAAALLKIPSAHEARLRKALEMDAPAMLKALDALAKELKLKCTGKDMIALLKKAKLL